MMMLLIDYCYEYCSCLFLYPQPVTDVCSLPHAALNGSGLLSASLDGTLRYCGNTAIFYFHGAVAMWLLFVWHWGNVVIVCLNGAVTMWLLFVASTTNSFYLITSGYKSTSRDNNWEWLIVIDADYCKSCLSCCELKHSLFPLTRIWELDECVEKMAIVPDTAAGLTPPSPPTPLLSVACSHDGRVVAAQNQVCVCCFQLCLWWVRPWVWIWMQFPHYC